MDNEKIKELAERYADKECEQSSLEDKELLQFHEDKILEFYDVLGFLLETHCIVEKEKVNDFWHEITTLYLNGGKITYDGARFMFQSLFGKELFNDTEK